MRLTPDVVERIAALRREIDRLVRDTSPVAPDIDPIGALAIPADIYEVDNVSVFEVELPGMTKDDIEVFVLHDILIIEGVKKDRAFSDETVRGGEPAVAAGAPQERTSYQSMEREFGRLRKVLEIPSAGDTSRVTAKLANGVLTITLPKVEERRGRRRKVVVEEP